MSEVSVAKIAISTSADEALSKSLERVNQNFEGGRVTKADLASWIVHYVSEAMNDTMIEEIQKAHFNQVAYLETLVKKMKSLHRESLGPEELTALQLVIGQQNIKKRPRAIKTSDKQE